MKARSWINLLAGALIGAAAAAGYQQYQRRPLARIPSVEGLDDPAVALGYGKIMRLPHIALLRAWLARQAARLMPAGEAADIGCGPGYLAIALARRAPGLRVTGVDLSDVMLVQAREEARAAGLAHRTDFRIGDNAALPFADAALDLVISTLSLHHWADPVTVLDEVARVLRPGGAFYIFDLRRDLTPPPWLLLWFATNVVVPRPLRYVGEPLGSRNAAYTPAEATALAETSKLTGWRVTAGPLWLTIEGHTPHADR